MGISNIQICIALVISLIPAALALNLGRELYK